MAGFAHFALYSTVRTDIDKLLKTLNLGIMGKHEGRQWEIPSGSFLDRPVSAITHHHRSNPSPFNTVYFVVADRLDWETYGILVVNLDFDGFIDATRMKANVAGDAVPSTEIANSDWYEHLRAKEDPNYPSGFFAVYVAEHVGGQKDIENLLEILNYGLEGRKEEAAPVCRLAPVRIGDVANIIKRHSNIAKEGGFDPTKFILADSRNWDEDGVVMVHLVEGAEPDSSRRPVDVAAEVMTWVHVGLLTWEEGKEWDDEKSEFE
ncbi:MAG: hypothetical protein M1833_000420 [Piccolia ochrophora]|nr:MAG: hypothetical protein M1833_000420 [Piccolia ochrophora]